jgi:hypothetical protein
MNDGCNVHWTEEKSLQIVRQEMRKFRYLGVFGKIILKWILRNAI